MTFRGNHMAEDGHTTGIRRVSAALFDREAAGTATETTPSVISPQVIRLCDSLKANLPCYVPVQIDPHGIYGFCNDGVMEKVKADSGAIMFGWTIWEYPQLYLTAEFHAIWVNSAGTFLDITPKPAGETRIVFAADPSYLPDFDFRKRPPNRRSRLYEAEGVAELSQRKIRGFKTSQIEYETRRAINKGMTLEQWVQSKIPVDPLPNLIDAFLCDADERDTLFTPTAKGAECSNPHRVRELDRSKMQKLREILTLLPRRRPQ
jgi:hypothetical protein